MLYNLDQKKDKAAVNCLVNCYGVIRRIKGACEFTGSFSVILKMISSLGVLILKYFTYVYQTLVSTRLAMLLLSGLTLAALSGATIYKSIFSSVWFLVLVVAFLINLLACTIKQSVKSIRLAKLKLKGVQKSWVLPDQQKDEVGWTAREFLRKRGYKVTSAQATTAQEADAVLVSARKNRYGYYGSAVFHWGMVLVTLGGLFTIAFGMSGTFALSEGSFFQDSHDAYLGIKEGKWRGERHGKFTMFLEGVDFQFDSEGNLSRFPCRVVIYENGQQKAKTTITGQSPFFYKGIFFYQYIYGFTPALVLKKGNELVAKFYVDLNTGSTAFTGDFVVPGNSLNITAEFIPNLDAYHKKTNRDKYVPKRPGLKLKVEEANREVYSGIVELGQEVRFDNYELGFDHYKKWASFTVADNPGLPLVYLGFLTGVTGLVLLYLFVPKEISVEVFNQDGDVHLLLNYHSGRFSGIFREEVASLVQELADSVLPSGTAMEL